MNQPIFSIEIEIKKETILALTKSDKFLAEAELASKNAIFSLMKMIDGNNKVTIPYYKNPCGRIYGSPDICQIWRPLKQTLFNDEYIDIDIVNAHIAIIIDICEKFDINHEKIADYHNNREEHLKKVMDHYEVDRTTAKLLFTSIMFGGSYQTWAKKHNKDPDRCLRLVYKLVKGYKKIKKAILEQEEFQGHREAAKLKYPNPEDQYEQDCSAFSSIIMHTESEHLMKAIKIIDSNDLVPCHDGFYIRKSILTDRPNLLDEINDAFTGTNIKFIEKKMDEVIDLESCKKFPINIFEDLELEDLAEYVIQNVPIKTQNGNLYIFNGVYWKNDNSSSNYPMMQKFYCEGCYNDLKTYVESSYDKVLKATTPTKKRKRNEDEPEDSFEKKQLAKMAANKTKFIKDLKNTREGHRYKQLIDKIKAKTENSEIRFDTNPDLFAFTNKIFDLKTGIEVTPSADQMISLTTGYAYKEEPEAENLEKYKEELQRILRDILPNEDDYNLVMRFLATGLSGSIIPYFGIFTGSGGNGKSLLQELMKSVLGDYYNIMSSATLQTSKASGADQSAASCHKKRLIVVSEPEKSDSVLKSSRIKEFTGNEAIAARALYSTTTLIENQGTYYMECNAIPKIDSPDEAITRRLFIVAFTSTFVSQERYDEISKENEKRPDYDYIMQNYKIVNQLYKTTAYKESVRPAMFHLLLQYYQEYLKNPVLKSQNESESHNFTTEYLGETWDFNTYMANCYQKMDAKSLVSARETYANAKDFVENTCIRIDTKFYEEFYLTYDPDRKQFKNLQDLKDFIRVSREYKDYYRNRKRRIGTEYGYENSHQLGTAILVGFERKKEESQAEKK